MEFPIKDFSSKSDQIADLVTFNREILNGKLHFCALTTFTFFIPNFESYQWPLPDSGFQRIQNSMYFQCHYSDELILQQVFIIVLTWSEYLFHTSTMKVLIIYLFFEITDHFQNFNSQKCILVYPLIQKQPPQVFCKNWCSRKFCKIHRKTPVSETSFLMKLWALGLRFSSVF